MHAEAPCFTVPEYDNWNIYLIDKWKQGTYHLSAYAQTIQAIINKAIICCGTSQMDWILTQHLMSSGSVLQLPVTPC